MTRSTLALSFALFAVSLPATRADAGTRGATQKVVARANALKERLSISRAKTAKKSKGGFLRGSAKVVGAGVGAGVGAAAGGTALAVFGGAVGAYDNISLSSREKVKLKSRVQTRDASGRLQTHEVEQEVIKRKVPGIVKTAIWGLAGAGIVAATGASPTDWPIVHELGRWAAETFPQWGAAAHGAVTVVAARALVKIGLPAGILGVVGLGGGAVAGGYAGHAVTSAVVDR